MSLHQVVKLFAVALATLFGVSQVFAGSDTKVYPGISCTPERLYEDRLYYSSNGSIYNNSQDKNIVVRCPIPVNTFTGFPVKVGVTFRNTAPENSIQCIARTFRVVGNQIYRYSDTVNLSSYSDAWVTKYFDGLTKYGHAASMSCTIPRDTSLTPASGIAHYVVADEHPFPY